MPSANNEEAEGPAPGALAATIPSTEICLGRSDRGRRRAEGHRKGVGAAAAARLFGGRQLYISRNPPPAARDRRARALRRRGCSPSRIAGAKGLSELSLQDPRSLAMSGWS